MTNDTEVTDTTYIACHARDGCDFCEKVNQNVHHYTPDRYLAYCRPCLLGNNREVPAYMEYFKLYNGKSNSGCMIAGCHADSAWTLVDPDNRAYVFCDGCLAPGAPSISVV